MTEWNERQLEELVRKMGLERTPGQEKPPIHLSLYGPFWKPEPLLTKIMQLGAGWWTAMGYDETDRVSVVRYLRSLGCLTKGALWTAAIFQRPLTLELAKLLVDAGADGNVLLCAIHHQQPLPLDLAKLLIDAGARHADALSDAAEYQRPLTLELAKTLIDAGGFKKSVLWRAAEYQQPLTLDLAKLLVDAGCDPAGQDRNGWNALVHLAAGGHPADPQVTDLFLSVGCRTDLDGCKRIGDMMKSRFGRILEEHAQWKESLQHIAEENGVAASACNLDWDR